MTKIFRLFLIVFVFGLLTGLPGAAQPEEDPLLLMLSLVPDTPQVRESLVSYADYWAMEAVRGIDTPSAMDFDGGTDLSALWIASSIGLSSGMQLSYLMPMLDDMRDAVGFGFFDIDRSLTFSEPPGMGVILNGKFDIDQIGRAFAARDYTEVEALGGSLLCGANGCENGTQMDLQNRNPANPFGGQFGRSEPLLMLPWYLLANSADYAVVESMGEVWQDEAGSLADARDYRAIVEAANELGTIIQINFISPQILTLDPLAMLGANADDRVIEAFEELMEENNPLPPYTVVGMVDIGAGDEQIALIALAYADPDIAQAAAEEVVFRLQTATSFAVNQPFVDILEGRDVTIGEPDVYESNNGLAIAMIPLRYPVPSNEPGDDSPILAPSSLGYRFLMDSVFRRDTAYIGLNMGDSE